MRSGLERRITGVLAAARVSAVVGVRTSAAFARRFKVEAERSGLSVDLVEKDESSWGVKVCSVCGAQNGRFEQQCFNCQTGLGAESAPATPTAKPVAIKPSRQAWLDAVLRARPRAVLNVPVKAVRARFLRDAPVAKVAATSVLDKVLSVFVMRPHRFLEMQPAKGVSGKSVLDRFVSVFVEKP